MADSDYGQAMPAYGQGCYVQSVILSSSTGNELTGGLTGLAATVSKDGGAFASCTNTPAEIGTTGYVSVLLTATEMTANNVIVKFAANNANAMNGRVFIAPVVMTETATAWNSQTVNRFEQVVMQGTAYSMNKVTIDNTSGALTVYKRDGTTTYFTGTASDDGTTTTKGTLS